MDHSIKKKPEKPRMRQGDSGIWACRCKKVMAVSTCGTTAYQDWQRTRAALNKHEGK